MKTSRRNGLFVCRNTGLMSQDRIQIKESNAASTQDIGIKTSFLFNQSKKSPQISETYVSSDLILLSSLPPNYSLEKKKIYIKKRGREKGVRRKLHAARPFRMAWACFMCVLYIHELYADVKCLFYIFTVQNKCDSARVCGPLRST